MKFIKSYGLLILFSALGVFYYLRYKTTPNINSEEISLLTDDGNTTPLSAEIKGNTVVHFYASWCGPCRAEMNDIKKNFESLSSKGLSFVFITDDSSEKMVSFRENMPEKIQFYRVESLKGIDIYSIPATYFYNHKKQIINKHLGAFSWSDTEAVDALISQLNK